MKKGYAIFGACLIVALFMWFNYGSIIIAIHEETIALKILQVKPHKAELLNSYRISTIYGELLIDAKEYVHMAHLQPKIEGHDLTFVLYKIKLRNRSSHVCVRSIKIGSEEILIYRQKQIGDLPKELMVGNSLSYYPQLTCFIKI